jgi:acetyltransferase (GNAT) family protein
MSMKNEPNEANVLFGNYSFRILSDSEFEPLFRRYRPIIFQTALEFDVRQALSLEETEAISRLRKLTGTLFRLNLGIYHEEELVGLSFGVQRSADTYYMVNTGIVQSHQGKGLYSALLPRILHILLREGFQIIYSRHTATNNQIIVPKLKAGFLITGLELSDVFGTLVHLSYFVNPIRRKLLDVRSGKAIPDAEIRPFVPF